MTAFCFPDNTVLCNFACVDSLPLLAKILDGRGRWVEAIAFEAKRSANIHPSLASISVEGWLGDPVEITDRHDIARIERLRRAVFGGRAGEPLRHLGEAQTCHVIQHWSEFAGSSWVSDDRESLRYARLVGIPALDTADLIGVAIADDYLSRSEGFLLLQRMVIAGRHPRVPTHPAHL
ncbi:hypothetical protein [Actinopolymorpha alba]|uniref:hypothetical protein n=1 Tax=Actinopolymorpha alba TaxID=533267 RepID=UPI00035FBD80|nr:hypothetical protein [Actinopolymorpha alba]